MATAAVLSPSLYGHRQTYCRVVAQILLADGYDVVVVAGVPPEVGPTDLCRYPLLSALETNPGFRFFPLPESGLPSLLSSPGGFAVLLDRLGVDAVFLTEADTCFRLLDSRVWRRGRDRRWVGVFIRTTNFRYQEEVPWRETLVERALSGSRRLRRISRNRRPDARLLHKTLLPRLRLLDCALYLDETFVWECATASWLPDIYSAGAWQSDEDPPETSDWAPKVAEFMARQRECPVFVYIGSNQARRGYDSLLRLAVAEGGCFVHCGRRRVGESYDVDVDALRHELEQRGALFETDGYYRSDATVDLFLKYAEVVVLPHRDHLGSSGVMLQALAARRPVLVPDRGLMAHRVRAYGLGRLYRHGDWGDLRRQYRELEREGRQGFVEDIESFMGFFSREQTENAVRYAMGYGARPASLPARPHAPDDDTS
ncbi:MAG TPA: hypothetical protein VJ787_10155 [Thermoleophilia bacterium]|nr:hypothetical protein [Thermoleophilia bacterium]